MVFEPPIAREWHVDFLLIDRNELYLNELNTIPGFTSIKHYPSLEACGFPIQPGSFD
jgi:D-alanine-D-alanine ligase-like ATP-grasp enzyme